MLFMKDWSDWICSSCFYQHFCQKTTFQFGQPETVVKKYSLYGSYCKHQMDINLSNVVFRSRQHCWIGAKMDISSSSGLPNDFALSKSKTIESG